MAIVGKRGALVAYGALLVASVTWPFFLPGEAFALRDMMVFDRTALTRASLGYGDLAARNVPQDALLGILPHPVLALRLIMVVSAAAGAYFAARLGRTPAGKAAAMTVMLWNPYVIERLLQGHWSLVAAAWLLPAVALAPAPFATLAHWLASLTPTGAIAAAAFSRGRRGAWVSALTCAPWVVAGLCHAQASTASAGSAAAFAPRAEAGAGTLGALVGLGGIWNGQAVPASRAAGFALVGVALFGVLALGWRAVPRRWLALAAAAFAIALAAWAGATAPLIAHVPGAGLLRDAQKFLILALPAFAAAAGALTPRRAGAALALALAQVPDAPLALAPLTPTAVEVPAVAARGRDVYFVDRPTLIELRGAPAVDPAPKAMNVVEPGLLLIDAAVIDPPSPRWVAAREAAGRAAEAADTEALRSLGVGLVVYPGGQVVDTGAPAPGWPPLGVALFALWCCVPLLGASPARRPGPRKPMCRRSQ